MEKAFQNDDLFACNMTDWPSSKARQLRTHLPRHGCQSTQPGRWRMMTFGGRYMNNNAAVRLLSCMALFATTTVAKEDAVARVDGHASAVPGSAFHVERILLGESVVADGAGMPSGTLFRVTGAITNTDDIARIVDALGKMRQQGAGSEMIPMIGTLVDALLIDASGVPVMSLSVYNDGRRVGMAQHRPVNWCGTFDGEGVASAFREMIARHFPSKYSEALKGHDWVRQRLGTNTTIDASLLIRSRRWRLLANGDYIDPAP
jgi:hypothetical protein